MTAHRPSSTSTVFLSAPSSLLTSPPPTATERTTAPLSSSPATSSASNPLPTSSSTSKAVPSIPPTAAFGPLPKRGSRRARSTALT